MSPAGKDKAPRTGGASQDTEDTGQQGKPTSATVHSQHPFVVIIDNARRRVWGSYPTRDKAEAMAAQLRTHGFAARVDESPEHQGDRRRFLVWAVLCGFAQPDRLTERIVAEIAQATTP